MNPNLNCPKGRPLLACLLLLVPAAPGRGYTNLSIAVYFRYQEVALDSSRPGAFLEPMAERGEAGQGGQGLSRTTRNAELVTESDVATMKKFFAGRGIKTCGGLGLTANEPNGFQSYCYSTPTDRDKVKAMTEFTARNFDEIILDDFFFSNCKCERCIAAKATRAGRSSARSKWTRSRAT